MTNFKPGDKAWTQIKCVRVIDDTPIFTTVRDTPVFHEKSDPMIPDVPHLDRIARCLAEHPETVEALEGAVDALMFESQKNEHWAGYRDERITTPLRDREIVSGLLRAMRGEAGS